MKRYFNLGILSLFALFTLANNVVKSKIPKVEWIMQVGETGSDGGYAIDIDRLGNVYTTGTISGTVDFDPVN